MMALMCGSAILSKIDFFNPLHPWWEFPTVDPSWFDVAYPLFNVVEGSVWCVLGGIVWMRYFQHRRSKMELLYGITFMLFGITDFWEAYQLTPLLIAVKGGILLILLLLRHHVMKQCYPDNKWY